MSMPPRAQRRAPAARVSRGLSLVESLVVTTITAVGVATALPGLQQLAQRQRVVAAALLFETDVQHARSLAVAGNQSVRISFDNRGPQNCYIVHTGAADDCSCGIDGGPARCTGAGSELRTVRFAPAGGVVMSSNARSIVFDGTRGTSSPAGTVRFTGADGSVIHQVVNVMGRVRSCTPGRPTMGFKAC